MNLRKSFLLIITCQFFYLTAFAENINNDNPLLANSWKRVFFLNGCVDTITYTSDGRFNVISAEEITEGTYSISKKLPSNFYKVTRKNTKDSGGADCLGDTQDDTGKEWTFFIKFTQSGDHVVCRSEQLATCHQHYRVSNASYADHKSSLPECTEDQYLELGNKLNKSLHEKVVYPTEARIKGWEGRAVMKGMVDLEKGNFMLAEIITSTGYPVLDESLMDATNLISMQEVDCKPRSSLAFFAFPIKFSLSDNKDDIKIDVKPYKF